MIRALAASRELALGGCYNNNVVTTRRVLVPIGSFRDLWFEKRRKRILSSSERRLHMHSMLIDRHVAEKGKDAASMFVM